MSNSMKILDFLKNNKGRQYCDDCLSEDLKIRPRQQVNQICRKLSESRYIFRYEGTCSKCSKINKLVNSI